MIALDTPITLPIIRQGIAQAWSWWTGELLQAMPQRLRNRISPAPAEYLIDFSYNEAVISQTGNSHSYPPTHIDLTKGEYEDDLADASELFDGVSAPEAKVRLANLMVLRRELELPATAEARLRQIVSLDLDRQTPFNQGDARFDVLVSERNKETGRIRVELAVIKNETVDAVLSFCRKLGIHPISMTVGSASEFNFLAPSERRRRRRSWRQPGLLVGAGIALLLAFNIGLSYERLGKRLSYLNSELVKARRDAQATEKLRAQLGRSQSEVELLSKANNQPNPLDMLNELTHILPDEVWLFQLEFSNGTIEIAGLAPSASDIIERLDKSSKFTNPKFKSPIMRLDQTKQDRFDITADIRSGELK